MNSSPLSPFVISYANLQKNPYLQVLRNTVGLNSYLGLFALCNTFFSGLHINTGKEGINTDKED